MSAHSKSATASSGALFVERELDPAERAFRAARHAQRKGRASSEQKKILREVRAEVRKRRRAARRLDRLRARLRAAGSFMRRFPLLTP